MQSQSDLKSIKRSNNDAEMFLSVQARGKYHPWGIVIPSYLDTEGKHKDNNPVFQQKRVKRGRQNGFKIAEREKIGSRSWEQSLTLNLEVRTLLLLFYIYIKKKVSSCDCSQSSFENTSAFFLSAHIFTPTQTTLSASSFRRDGTSGKHDGREEVGLFWHTDGSVRQTDACLPVSLQMLELRSCNTRRFTCWHLCWT